MLRGYLLARSEYDYFSKGKHYWQRQRTCCSPPGTHLVCQNSPDSAGHRQHRPKFPSDLFVHADLHLQFEIATSMHNLALTPQPPPRPLTPISSLPFAGCCLSVQPRRNELLDPTLRQRSVQLLVLRSHGPARHNVAFRRKRGGGLAIILTFFFCAFETHWLRRSGGCQASVYS